ncbi:MAG: radical SAM family heme chaperone HemW [Pseudomonadota bacterium]
MTGTPPLGLYVHVPYCRSLCPYCDFYSLARDPDAGFAEALTVELSARLDEVQGLRPAATVYHGGGTPSLLAPRELGRWLESVARHPGLVGDAEITLEANPGDLDEATARALVSAGINRLSLGVQSLDDRWLRVLGRRHDAATVQQAVLAARRAGISNLGVDVILAVPGQQIDDSARDVEAVIGLGAEHVSAYLLTIEPETPLGQQVAQGTTQPVDEDLAADMLELACARLQAAGYQRYEISNHARSGRASRHNRLYWSGGEILGLGPGAHSYLWPGPGARRRSNPDALEAWLRRWRDGDPAALSGLACVDEVLGPAEGLLERLFLGLRDLERGVDLEALQRVYGILSWPTLHATLEHLREDTLLLCDRTGRWILSARGQALADAVARSVLAIETGDSVLSGVRSCEMVSPGDE